MIASVSDSYSNQIELSSDVVGREGFAPSQRRGAFTER